MTPKQFVELCARANAPVPAEYAKPSAEHVRNTRRKEVDGIAFRSTLEATVYQLLALWEKAGAISELKLQPRFIVQDKFKRDGQTIRSMRYTADFQFQRDGKTIICEAKGHKTQPYLMRRKMFLSRYQDLVHEEWTRETLKALRAR